MEQVTVIGMDLGDKNHKAVVLAADGAEIERVEVSNTLTKYRSFWNGIPAHCWRSRRARTVAGSADWRLGWTRSAGGQCP